VRLERWHGQYVALTAGGHRIEVDDWHPRRLAVLLILAPVSALVIALLWRFKVMSSEGTKGAKTKLRSALDVLIIVYGGTYLLLLCYVAVPASSPLLYLR
jgi:hypothetical protein